MAAAGSSSRHAAFESVELDWRHPANWCDGTLGKWAPIHSARGIVARGAQTSTHYLCEYLELHSELGLLTVTLQMWDGSTEPSSPGLDTRLTLHWQTDY